MAILSLKSPQQAFSLAVGQTSTAVLDEKTTSPRTILLIVNTSTLNQIVSLGIGQDAVAGVGVTLYPGQSYIESPSEGFRPTIARITAIASAASGAISVYERSE